MITRVVFGLGLTSMESPTLTRMPFLDFITPKSRASASRVSLSLNEAPHGTVYRSGASSAVVAGRQDRGDVADADLVPADQGVAVGLEPVAVRSLST